jgi:YfiH family protein
MCNPEFLGYYIEKELRIGMIDFYRFKNLSNEPGCMHAVTKKDPDEPYALSLALHTGEALDEIVANRQKIISELDLAEKTYFVVAEQTHSDNITVITQTGTKGWEALENAVSESDALVTALPNVMLAILTADCVPILLYDRKRKAVAAVHAGWKGTRSEIVLQTVRKMIEVYGSDPADILAGIAPSIGVCCYEVGEEVAEHFSDIPDVLRRKGKKYMLDLPAVNHYQLLEAGIPEPNIELSGVCTACEVDSFFSYRKEQGCSGRFMSLIGIRN